MLVCKNYWNFALRQQSGCTRRWTLGETFQEKSAEDPSNQPASFAYEEAVLEEEGSYLALGFGSWKFGGKMGRVMDLLSYRNHGYGALEAQETDLLHHSYEEAQAKGLLHHSHEEAQAKGLLNDSPALELETGPVSRSRVMARETGLWGRIHDGAREMGLGNDIREEEQEMEPLDRSRGEEQGTGPYDHIHEGGRAMVLVNGSPGEEQAMDLSRPRACSARRKRLNPVVLGVWESP